MSFDLLLTNIAKHIHLTEEEAKYVTSLFTYKKVAKKELVLAEGQVCRYIHYVHSGALRAYHVDKDYKDITVMFAVADWWVTDMFCFVTAKPAMMYIEAIEDSCIFQLSKANLDSLFQTLPKWERFFRILMQNAYIREQLRMMEALSLSAEERYDTFLGKYPQIAQQVTQKQIASYLGITPEFLSAIRKKKSIKIVS